MDGLREEELTSGTFGQRINLRRQRSPWRMSAWCGSLLALVRDRTPTTEATRPNLSDQIRTTQSPQRPRHRLLSFLVMDNGQLKQDGAWYISSAPYHSDRLFRTWR